MPEMWRTYLPRKMEHFTKVSGRKMGPQGSKEKGVR